MEIFSWNYLNLIKNKFALFFPSKFCLHETDGTHHWFIGVIHFNWLNSPEYIYKYDLCEKGWISYSGLRSSAFGHVSSFSYHLAYRPFDFSLFRLHVIPHIFSGPSYEHDFDAALNLFFSDTAYLKVSIFLVTFVSSVVSPIKKAVEKKSKKSSS